MSASFYKEPILNNIYEALKLYCSNVYRIRSEMTQTKLTFFSNFAKYSKDRCSTAKDCQIIKFCDIVEL